MTATDYVMSLAEGFCGQLLTSDDAGYDVSRRVHNGLIDKRPTVIARCLNTPDVAEAVNTARDAGLELSVRGGGHNVAGKAVCEGGLMIDLSLMKGIHTDPVGRAVRAQGGVTVGELDRATATFGLAVPSGTVSSTGIDGLTLGGGHGWLMGRYGITVDNLLSAEVVLASGEAATASPTENPDLFWAIRGGGGNFGVATSFELRAHAVASVLSGPVLHTLDAARGLVSFYRDFCAELPDELSIQIAFIHAPDGSGAKLCAVAMCHCAADPEQAETDVAPLRAFGSPAADMVQRVPYPVTNTGVDWLFSPGTLGYWKSAFFTELTDAAAVILIQAFERAPTESCALVIEEFHGAPTRIDPAATAYPHRQPGHNLLLISQWSDLADTDKCIAWARTTIETLEPHMDDRSYTNYLPADEHDRVRQAYGVNYDRLLDFKRRYYPNNCSTSTKTSTPRRTRRCRNQIGKQRSEPSWRWQTSWTSRRNEAPRRRTAASPGGMRLSRTCSAETGFLGPDVVVQSNRSMRAVPRARSAGCQPTHASANLDCRFVKPPADNPG